MFNKLLIALAGCICVASTSPYNYGSRQGSHAIINPALTDGTFEDGGIHSIRTRSVAEECERLQLCRLHARSAHNFLAAFQLYFVNKENAKLWDHQQHSAADCEQRYAGCYGHRARSEQYAIDHNSIQQYNDDY